MSRWLVCFAVYLAAVDQAGQAQELPPNRVRLRGRVVDQQQLGVTGAKVTFPQPDNASAISGENGLFTIEVEKDRVDNGSLWANLAGRKMMGYARTDDLEHGEAAKIVLKPARELTVKVVDASGHPISGATAAVLINYWELDVQQTGDDGQADFQLPVDAPVMALYAFRDGKGFDYLLNTRFRDVQPNVDLPDQVELTLDGAAEVTVQLVDSQGKPAAAVDLYPWLIEKPGHADNINLGGAKATSQTTNEEGIAHFKWFPENAARAIPINARSHDFFASERVVWNPGSGENIVKVVVDRTVLIAGRVVRADGTGAERIDIQVEGRGASIDYFRRTVSTAENGSFQLKVYPNFSYILTVVDENWASNNIVDVEVGSEPITDLKLTLTKGTTIHGQVTDWMGAPLSNVSVNVHVIGSPLPANRAFRAGNRPLHLVRWARSDENGRYSIRVGPGEYEIGYLRSDPLGMERLTVSEGDGEIVRNYRQAEIYQRFPLTGLVKTEAGTPIARASIEPVQLERMPERDLPVATNAKGEFLLSRLKGRLRLIARSPDLKLGGFADVEPDQLETTITLHKTSSIRGQLVDGTGRPVPNTGVFLSARHDPERRGAMMISGTPAAITDDRGNFTIEHLLSGMEYECFYKEGNALESLVEFRVQPPAGVSDIGPLTIRRAK